MVSALLAPAAAHAVPDWTAPADLSFDSRLADGVGFTAGGAQTVAHIEITNLVPADLHTRLVVSAKQPGGAFVEQLSIPSTPTAVPIDLELAVAPNGSAVLSWAEMTTTNYGAMPAERFHAAYRTPAGVWGAPIVIATDTAGPDAAIPSNIQLVPFAAIGNDGTALAGAGHQEPNDAPEPAPGQPDSKVDVAIHGPTGPWHAVETLSTHNKAAYSPVAGIDAAGDITVAWRERFTEGATSATTNDIYTAIVRRRPASNGVWSVPQDLTGSDSAKEPGSPRLGVAASGAAVIAFQVDTPSGPADSKAWAATRPDAGHDFTGLQAVLTTGATSSPAAAGVAPDGAAYVLYTFQGSSSLEDSLGAVRLPAGDATWSTPRTVSATNFMPNFLGGIAFLGNDAFFAWHGTQNNGGVGATEAVRWRAGAAQPDGYRDLDTGATSGALVALVPDLDGGVAAAWKGGATPGLREAAFDGGAPHLLAAGPATAVAGHATTFTATFVDLWSALAGGPTWSFGDGTPAVTGSPVAHTFAAAGAHTVTVSRADALGNLGTRSFTVNVTAAPDTVAPKVTLTKPKKSKRKLRSAWRTLKGKVTDAAPSSGIAKVEVGVELKRGKKTFALSGKRFKASKHSKAKKTFVKAKLKGKAWSLKLPSLKAGTYTFRVRATDAAGNVSKVVSVTVKLK